MTPFVFALCFASLGASELTVESVPAGAAVRVDDLPPGIAPFTVDLKPGSHTIQVSTDGYVTETRQVVLQDDKSESVSVILEAKPVEYYDTEGDIAFWGGLGAGAALAGFGHWGAADSADRIRNDDIDARIANKGYSGMAITGYVVAAVGVALGVFLWDQPKREEIEKVCYDLEQTGRRTSSKVCIPKQGLE